MKKVLLGLLALFLTGTAGALSLAMAYPASQPAASVLALAGGSGAAASGGSAASGYTKAEVAAHAQADDCWLIVRGNVYDVTGYIPAHPGGRLTITDTCGQEVTSVFAAIHSNRAWDLLGRYRIGALTTGPANQPVAAASGLSPVQQAKAVSASVLAAHPGATVLYVHPFGQGYTALIADGNRLIDLVTDSAGVVQSERTRRDELEWFWDSDDDEADEWERDHD